MTNTFAQTDTVRVMSYNILNYGDGCQGSLDQLDGYLNTIIAYAKPDILGLAKISSSENTALNAVNNVSGNKYAIAPYTNNANGKYSVLWYNTNKFGYISTNLLYSYISDFDLYKLYYKAPNLSSSQDTAFLYVVVNHTNSGTAPDAARDQQLSQTLAALKSKFARLPNLVNMGDFNLHDSNLEAGYQALVAGSDTNYLFYDPVIYPDKTYTYPLLNDSNPSTCAPFLTTSTRQSGSVPNSCGTSGGAKGWFDRILISSDLVHNKAKICYVPYSLQTLGNDGKRVGISINDSTINGKNNSAPPAVINALFQFSNKYPMMAKFSVNLGSVAGLEDAQYNRQSIGVNNPIKETLHIIWPSVGFSSQSVTLSWCDVSGSTIVTQVIDSKLDEYPAPHLQAGIYFLKIQGETGNTTLRVVKE